MSCDCREPDGVWLNHDGCGRCKWSGPAACVGDCHVGVECAAPSELRELTEVPEWCRTEVEDAISDAVVRWARGHIDQVNGMSDHDALADPLRILRMAISGTRVTVARDVIAALQGVGVPFSGATGAGAERETDEPPKIPVHPKRDDSKMVRRVEFDAYGEVAHDYYVRSPESGES